MSSEGSSHPGFSEAEDRFTWLANQPMHSVIPKSGFLRGADASLRSIIEHRHLWRLLTKRELKARYKDSALGYMWTLIRPLINLLIYYLAIGQVLGAQRSISDFAVFVFSGLTIWSLFAGVISGATSSILGNSGIVKKVYLPRELFPLTASAAATVDFLSQLGILICGALIIRGIDLGQALLFAPISFAVALVWAVAAGLLLSALNVYFRDIQYLVEVFIMIGFWLTPCVYSYQMIVGNAPPFIADLYLMNPTAIAVMGFQRAFWLAGADTLWPPDMLERLGLMLVVGIVLAFLAQRAFDLLQRNFAQEL